MAHNGDLSTWEVEGQEFEVSVYYIGSYRTRERREEREEDKKRKKLRNWKWQSKIDRKSVESQHRVLRATRKQCGWRW